MMMMMLMARVKTETMMNLVTMTMVMTSATAMMMTMMTMMMTRTAMMMQSQAATPASGWPADRKKPHNHNFYSLPTTTNLIFIFTFVRYFSTFQYFFYIYHNFNSLHHHQPNFHFDFCSIFFLNIEVNHILCWASQHQPHFLNVSLTHWPFKTANLRPSNQY